MLKAGCNAFHALKIAFANGVGALCSALSIDGHSLMAQFVQDTKLNISPAYLRPGLPFGVFCLLKDLRMIVQIASCTGVELPVMCSFLVSDEVVLHGASEACMR